MICDYYNGVTRGLLLRQRKFYVLLLNPTLTPHPKKPNLIKLTNESKMTNVASRDHSTRRSIENDSTP